MSNIPPLVSSSPPPMVAGELEDLDDEFGDFTAAAELSFEDYSLPSSPQHKSNSSSLPDSYSLNNDTKNQSFNVINENTVKLYNRVSTTDCHGNLKKVEISSQNMEPKLCDIKSDVNSKSTYRYFNSNKSSPDDSNLFTSTIDFIEAKSLQQNSDNVLVVSTSNSEIYKQEVNSTVCNTEEINLQNSIKKEVLCNIHTSQEENILSKTNAEVEVLNNVNKQCNKMHVNEEVEDYFNLNSLSNRNNDAFNKDTSFNELQLNANELNNFDEKQNKVLLESQETFNFVVEKSKINFQKEYKLQFEGSTSKNEVRNIDEEKSIINEKIPPFHIDAKEFNTVKEIDVIKENIQDEEDFGEFTFTSLDKIKLKAIDSNNLSFENSNQDDFGDFNDYCLQDDIESQNLENISNANAESVIKTCFLSTDVAAAEINIIDFTTNTVFENLQDIENSNALGFQWPNSESQKILLKALNIDARNILFGPRWNATMPRFAANLGFRPLEPVKAELSTTSSTTNANLTPEQNLYEVPAAKFDWISSGLVNPLDYSQANTMLLDLEQLVPSLDIPHVNIPENSAENLSLDLNSWDYWLQSQSSDTTKSEIIEDKHSLNQSSELKQMDLNFISNLNSDNESVNSLKFIEASSDLDSELKLDSDNTVLEKTMPVIDNNDCTIFQSLKIDSEVCWTSNTTTIKLPLKESYISVSENQTDVNSISDTERFGLKSMVITTSEMHQTFNSQHVEDIDNEFTDFQMSLPQTIEPKKDLSFSVPLEPLKPIVLEPSVINSASTQINWPEPGVVNEDINNFSFFPTQAIEPNKQEKPNDDNLSNERKKEDKVEEEDDWSDFVFVQEHAINNKILKSQINTLTNVTNQISQLELSIPNLQNTQINNSMILPRPFLSESPVKKSNIPSQQIDFGYQPPYQIPLQTINTSLGGLTQTSLSSLNSCNFTIGPTELPLQPADFKKTTSDIGIFDSQFTLSMKPLQPITSPIKTKTASHFENFSEAQVQSVESIFLKMQQPLHTSNSSNANEGDDDEDWSEFVSSQPVSLSSQNSINFQSKTILKNNFDWPSESTTNIISNPIHFDSFQNYQSHRNDSNATLNNKTTNLHQIQMKNKNSISSLSVLPDLDFVAPKNKFFSKK